MRALQLSLLFGLLSMALGANILAILPMPSKSHAILIERLLRTLEERGHTLTYLTSHLPDKPLKDAKIIHLDNLREVMFMHRKKSGDDQPPNLLSMREISPWFMPLMMAGMGNNLMDHILKREEVQAIIRSSEKFDLILGEIFLDESLLAGFSAKFKAPIVAVQTFMPGVWANYMVGNPAPASYIPDPFLGFGTKMTFCERVVNLVFGLYSETLYIWYHLPRQDSLMRKYFGSDLPPIGSILKNTSLVLVNHHHSIGFPRPYLPNIIEIGGFHINKPKPLPKDLQTFMDNSPNGVILFSLGSNAQSSDMKPEIIQSIVKAFAKLDQNILWKFEKELPGLPKNVKIMPWLPQSDILAHPNLRLFITHGGLLSTTEAVERGVPVVGIPLFGDQPLNMKHTENAGLGKTIQFEEISEDLVYNIVSEVLNNPKYKEVALSKSQLLKDNPMSAIESAVWWIEYVLRHKGAPHLRSAAQDLAWYQLYLLDVYLIAATVITIAVALQILIAKWIIKKIFCRFCTKKVESGKKND